MSFKENFERKESDKLNFDDSAFYYYMFGFLFFLLLPLTYLLVIKPMLFGEMIIKTSIKNCQC